VGHVTHASKTALFRNCKFIKDVKEEEDVAKDLIPFLPVKLLMLEEEFVENYKGVVHEGIKAACTDVQSTGKKRAQGASNFCKIPTFWAFAAKLMYVNFGILCICAELFDHLKELGNDGLVLPTAQELWNFCNSR